MAGFSKLNVLTILLALTWAFIISQTAVSLLSHEVSSSHHQVSPYIEGTLAFTCT